MSFPIPVHNYFNIVSGDSIRLGANVEAINIQLTASGPIVQTSGVLKAPIGTMAVNCPGQIATFNSFGNQIHLLVVPPDTICLVNGSFNSTGLVQVNGTLGGSGSVGTVTVLNSGKIAPGNSPGKLTTGNIVFNSSTVFSIELNGLTPATEYDQLAVAGTVNLGGATLVPSLGFIPGSSQAFKIIDNDDSDPVVGTFNGYAEGSTVTINGFDFTISYQGGDGNDVTLTAPWAPAVNSVVLDNGTAGTVVGVSSSGQRSEVRRIIVTFSEAVNFTGSVADAFTLHRNALHSLTPGPNTDVVLIANPAAGPAASVTITFAGPITDSTGSLIDGVYDLTIDSSKVSSAGGPLNGSGTPGSDYQVIGSTANKFFRLFGDANGDGTVSQSDYLLFSPALSSGPNPNFDYQNSGDVNQVDYLEFRNRIQMLP
jgi:hypothetical protein